MVDLIRGLCADRVRENLERVRAEISAAGRDLDDVEILAAVKYVPVEELGVLAQAGIERVGENQAQDLVAKADAHRGVFTWDYIGHLQSRKVRQVLPYVRYIHSVASDSALEQLARHASAQGRRDAEGAGKGKGKPEVEVLVEVNVSGERGKSGVPPAGLPSLLERCPVKVVGLMTMPPFASSPEASRPWFAALRELAKRHGLRQLSMGTSQDYVVAVQEGATILRLGRCLYTPAPPATS